MTNARLTARGTVRTKRMFQRTTIARLSIGLVLGLVLAVVLHQSNTRDPNLYSNLLSQGAFGGTASATVDAASEATVVSSAPDEFYICACGGCVSSGMGTPGEWGTPMLNACPSNCPDTTQWPPEIWNVCGLNVSSSVSYVYCCYESGNPSNCAQVTECTPGLNATTYVDDLSCLDSCDTTVESSASSVFCCYGPGQPNNCSPQAVCGDGTVGEYPDPTSCTNGCVVSSASSVDPNQYCCMPGVPAANNCTPFQPPCVAGGACNCSTCVENCAPGVCG